MEIKTAFSSQFNNDAAIKGSGLLNIFFFFCPRWRLWNLEKHRNDILRRFFFSWLLLFTFTLNETATNNENSNF